MRLLPGTASRRDKALLERYRAEAKPLLARLRPLAPYSPSWYETSAAISTELRSDPRQAIALLASCVASDDRDETRLFPQLASEGLVQGQLPFTAEDASMLVWVLECHTSDDSWTGVHRARAVVAALEARAAAGDDVSRLAERVLVQMSLARNTSQSDWTKLGVRVRRLTGTRGDALDLSALPGNDPWSTEIRPEIEGRFADQGRLLTQLATATQSRPARRWVHAVEPLLEGGGLELVRFLLETAVDAPHVESGRFRYEGRDYVVYTWLHDTSATVVRGALWAASLAGEADWVAPLCERLVARARAADQVKVGNACMICLGERADDPAVAALARIVAQMKDRRFLKPAQTALVRAAERRGISAAQLRERIVPDFGLDADGLGSVPIGSGSGLVELVAPATVKARYLLDGRETASVPQQLQSDHADEQAAFKKHVAELRKELGVQRVRMEALLADDRTWSLGDWRRYYLEHPVMQLFARRLIWLFDGVAAIPLDPDGPFVSPSGPLEPAEDVQVRLWHPLDAPPGEVAGWRVFLREHRLRQPFKQAYREIYVLAPAERETEIYSNRFAAHIVSYPQVYALAKQRGWGVRALGWFDNDGGEQWRDFPEQGLRASFWMELADPEPGARAIADLAATDQLRFSRIGERDAVPLEEVPSIVFSEAARDVDLFVAVASIAADPYWADRGVDRYDAYWHQHAYGELGASAELRRELLAELIPGLKIADRLELDDRWLHVQGQLHRYRIHLGSANVLIEPEDRYLCIVPDRKPSSLGKLFLPFEDERLSVILSKALLLVADDKITDKTITHQLR